VSEEEFQPHNDTHYQYYVNFADLNRRWDCYITRGNIEVVILHFIAKIIRTQKLYRKL